MHTETEGHPLHIYPESGPGVTFMFLFSLTLSSHDCHLTREIGWHVEGGAEVRSEVSYSLSGSASYKQCGVAHVSLFLSASVFPLQDGYMH